MHKRRRSFVCWTRRSAAGSALMLQVRPESDALYPSRLQVKDGSFRDLPFTTELSASLGRWFAFLESFKGVRLRRGRESTSRDRRSSFLSGMARFLATRHSTHVSSSPARARGCRLFPRTPCVIRLPCSCSTSAEPTCATSRRSWAIRVSQQPPAHAHRFQAAAHSRGKPPAAFVSSFSVP
jgi:hypothetical protein